MINNQTHDTLVTKLNYNSTDSDNLNIWQFKSDPQGQSD